MKPGLWLGLLAAVTAAGHGCLSPIVGAQCADGYVDCGGVCLVGPCRSGDDAGIDGAGIDDAGIDGAIVDAAVDAMLPDAGPPVCELGALRCGDACVDPDTDLAHCGGCDQPCPNVCVGGTCLLTCDPPRMECGTACVDLQTNPLHCGACDTPCVSGVCEAGVCQGSTPGHVVVIGHNYRQSSAGVNRILGNAVFLPLGNPVRVVAYTRDARVPSINGANAAINQVANATGRSWLRTETSDPNQVTYLLRDAQVLLIYSQADAADDDLEDTGAQWRLAINSFARRGGVVVLMDGGGSHDGTFQLLTPSGLFSALALHDVTGTLLSVVAATDSVATNVPVTYTAPMDTVSFEGATPSHVVAAPAGQPVVVHSAVTP